jgi:hypothetical protein
METGTEKRVLPVLLSAIVPGSGQVLKKEIKKAIVYLVAFGFLLFLTWPTRFYETFVG